MRIKENYYLYKIKSVWDPEKGRARKVTEKYLGKITPDGIVKPKHVSILPLGEPLEYYFQYL